MSAATRNNTDEGQKLVTETKEISDRLKDMEKAVGDNRRNVGNYAESIQEAMSSTKGLSGATANGYYLESVEGKLSPLKSQAAKLNFTKAWKLLKRTQSSTKEINHLLLF